MLRSLRALALLGLSLTPTLALAAVPSTLQLPATTTAYTAGQLMANSATGANVVVPQLQLNNLTFGVVAIQRGHISINDTTVSSWNGQSITIDLWTAAPTFANGDRSAYSPTGVANHLGSLICILSPIYGDGAYGDCYVTTGPYITIPAGTPQQIYWTATATTGSGTTGASKVLSFTPEIVN